MVTTLLIVDGETSVLRTLGYALGRLEYETVGAVTAREGLKKAVTERPDLVIVDSNLPDMEAAELCRKLRQQPATSDVPIIMLADETGAADRMSGLKAGADEYITKPFDANDVAARVQALLSLTRRSRVAHPTKRGKTVAVIGAKGGVGTTTVALNIAATLASRNVTTIAVELRNSFGTCALQLGARSPSSLSALLELAPERIGAQVLRKQLVGFQPGVGMLFGPQEGDDLQEIGSRHAKAILQGLAGMAAYTIVDLPCILSAATRTAIQESDYVIVVIEYESLSWSAGKVLLAQLASWGLSKGLVGAVIVKRSPSGRPLKAAESSLELRCDVLGVFPPAEDACQMAHNACVPIVLSQGGSMPAIALTEIANKLQAKLDVPASV